MKLVLPEHIAISRAEAQDLIQVLEYQVEGHSDLKTDFIKAFGIENEAVIDCLFEPVASDEIEEEYLSWKVRGKEGTLPIGGHVYYRARLMLMRLRESLE